MTPLPMRLTLIELVDQAMLSGARQAKACEAIALEVRTLQRWQSDKTKGDLRPQRLQKPSNALSQEEWAQLLHVLNSAEFSHLPPGQVVPKLADRKIYLASESTMYRALRAAGQLKHRRSERPAQPHAKPQGFSATAANQLYSWDITYLPSTVRGIYFYLYAFIDIFSRKLVGWQVYERESSELASEVLQDICQRERIAPQQLVLHSDNGSPMKGASMLAMLNSLGVTASLSRPAVSNDNPFSESVFRTLKYRPDYPKKPFDTLTEARQWVERFTQWYNNEHQHSAIGFVTPSQRHAGLDAAILQQRETVYAHAKAANPQRWSGETRNWKPVTIVHLNPDKNEEIGHVKVAKEEQLKAA
ncbi:MAG: IS3 family transposase [Rheinheimera sp.]|nr:IS3 family transposase [Rheinheimera sp.]